MSSSEVVRLDGKVAIVTGSSTGWGRAVAEELARRGAAVCINSRTPAAVDAVVASINANGGQALGCIADVSRSHDVDRLIQTAVDTFGRLDVMVNNAAGGRRPVTVLEQTDAEWHAQQSASLNSVFYGTRAAGRVFVEQGQGGRIINMAGSSGVFGMAESADMAAAKGGVLAATFSWALELAQYGVTVNAVRAAVESSRTAQLIEQAGGQKSSTAAARADNRERGIFPANEAAGLVVWLASDSASGATGRFFGVDGPKLSMWELASAKHVLWNEPQWDTDSIARQLPELVACADTQAKGVGEVNPAYRRPA